MKKPLWSFRLGNWTLWLVAGGTMTFWLDRFISHYARSNTCTWPLPADSTSSTRCPGHLHRGRCAHHGRTLLFYIDVFKTITYTPAGWEAQPPGPARLRPRIHRAGHLFRRRERRKEQLVPAVAGHRPRLGGHA